MYSVEVRGLTQSFGAHRVLDGMDFTVEAGQYAVVLGQSGCGKTTLLKTMAGLYEPDSGSVLIGGKDVTHTEARERRLGFFFQNYSLFPHMTVRENVGYSLAVAGKGKREVDTAVEEYLRMVGLSSWADHYPRELSGGMQQRTALARTLATGYKVMLLDEPLSALDAKIASLLRRELYFLSKRLGLTIIHVTPRQDEALDMAEKVILMRDGRVVQEGSDVDVYTRPEAMYSAYFLGESNFIRARRRGARAAEHHGIVFGTLQDIRWDDCILAVRPEKILFAGPGKNTLGGTVESVSFLGPTTRYEIRTPGGVIVAETSKMEGLKKGDSVTLRLPEEDISVFDAAEAEGLEAQVI